MGPSISPQSPRKKKLLIVTVWTLFFFACLEILCWIFPVTSKRGDHSGTYQKKLDDVAYRNLTRTGHPYFGNVFRSDEKVNNMGFTSQYDYPYKEHGRDYVVAVLGGSVAHDFAVDVGEEFGALLKKKNPRLKDLNVVVLNMAIHGFKQPQQFFVASYFHPSIDLAVNIDGFNEFREGDPDYPVEYPGNAAFYLISSRDRAKSVYFAGLVSNVQEILAGIPLWTRVLSYSQAYQLFWSVTDHWLEYLIREKILSLPPPSQKSHSIHDRLDVWKRFTQDQSTLLEARQVSSYFFIQPNQYVPGSKVLTAEEKKIAFKGPDDGVREWYRLLTEAAGDLRRKDVKVFDLSQVFQDATESIYIDDCCHINKRGNLILAEAMAEKIEIK